MVDANLKVEPVRIGVNTISQTTNSNRNKDFRSTLPIPKKIISPWTQPRISRRVKDI